MRQLLLLKELRLVRDQGFGIIKALILSKVRYRVGPASCSCRPNLWYSGSSERSISTLCHLINVPSVDLLTNQRPVLVRLKGAVSSPVLGNGQGARAEVTDRFTGCQAGVGSRTRSRSYTSHSRGQVGSLEDKELVEKTESSHVGDMSNLVVGHDKGSHCFYIQLKTTANSSLKAPNVAKLEYRWLRPNLVDLYHTEVPPEFQGQGIAKVLAKATFDYFCDQEIRFRPTCTYLQKFLRENPIPRYADLVDKNFE